MMQLANANYSEIYNEDKIQDLELVQIMRNVKCSVMEHGLKKIFMNFHFCTCDPNQKDPICEECAHNCHQGPGHTISPVYLVDQNDKMKNFLTCMCGIRCHKLADTINNKNEILYQPSCFFNEMAIHTKTYTYYMNGKGNIICLFCFNFCTKSYNSSEQNFTKYQASSEKEVPACNCTTNNHLDAKSILNKLFYLTDPQQCNIDNMFPLQMLNLLVKCEKSFNNLFSYFIDTHEKLFNELNDKNHDMDKKMNLSNYYWSVLNFATNAMNIKNGIYYFSKNLVHFYDMTFIMKLLDRKLEDNAVIFSYVKAYLIGFQKFHVGNNFTAFPNIKIIDYANMTALQRLIITSNVRKNTYFMAQYIDHKENIIDRFLSIFDYLIKSKFNDINGYSILLRLSQIIKKFAKFYFLSHEQMIKFCSVVDDVFYSLSDLKKKLSKSSSQNEGESNFRETELKIMINISKILIYFSLSHNDSNISKLITTRGTVNENSCNFVHMNNELGVFICRSMIHLVNYLKDQIEEIKKKTKEETSSYSEKIKKNLDISHYLVAMTLSDKDFYVTGLRRCINKNIEVNIKMINGGLSHKEEEFLTFLEGQTKVIEDNYYDYFNFDLDFPKLERMILRSLTSFFEEVDGRDFQYPQFVANEVSIISDAKPTKTLNEDQEELKYFKPSSVIPYNILMNKTNYIFTIIKIFSISNKNQAISTELVECIFKFLHFYISKQPDNCITSLSSQFLYSFENCSIIYSEHILNFFICSFKLIQASNYEIPYIHMYLSTAMKIFYKNIGKDNMYPCLNKLLKIMKFISLIQNTNKNNIILTVRAELKKIYEVCKLIGVFKEYLLNLSENSNKRLGHNVSSTFSNNRKDFNNVELYNNISLKQGITCPITLALKIYLKFIKLTTEAFDDNALFSDTDFLSSVLNTKEIIKILKIKNMDITLRTEFIKFFRMIYIDVPIDTTKMTKYRKEFVKDFDTVNENGLIGSEEMKVFAFLEKLMNISEIPVNTEEEYEILIYEMKNIKEIIESSKNNDHVSYINYFENGILLPLKVYLNKIFSIVINISGREFLKIFEFCYCILEMKKYVLQSNFYNKDDHSDPMANLNALGINKKESLKNQSIKNQSIKMDKDASYSKNSKLEPKSKSIINITKFNQNELSIVEMDLKRMSDTKFQALDYLHIYEIITKHIMSLIQNPTSLNLVRYFSEYDDYRNEQAQSFKSKLQAMGYFKDSNSYDSMLFDCINNYEKAKNDFENSSIKASLNETHLELEVNFRNLFTSFLFFLTGQEVYPDSLYSKEGNEIILKLLQNETSPTQKEVMNIYQKNEEHISLKKLAENCFKNLLSIIFSQYNPTSVELSDDYHLACHIIKIFKFLCEEHNNFFQNIFMKKLSFQIDEHKKIMFFDMMVSILDKLIILSGWDALEGDVESGMDYFYALFSCIVELLIEVVQGTKKENFSLLFREEAIALESEPKTSKAFEPIAQHTHASQTHTRNFYGGTKTNFGMSRGTKFTRFYHDPTLECGKSLPIYLRNIKGILFNDNAFCETLYKVRKELVDFLLAFMEEYACPKNIKKLIMSSYHPSSILKSITVALKKYYMRNFNSKRSDGDFQYASTRTRNALDLNSEELPKRRTTLIIDKTYGGNKKNKAKDKKLKRLKFTEKLFHYFTNLYFGDEEFVYSSEFEFCSAFYNYFKLSILEHNFDESVSFWEKIQKISPDDLYDFNKRSNSNEDDDEEKMNFDELDYEFYYVIKFFEQVSKSVWIKLQDHPNPVRVVYTLSPLLKFLSKNSKMDFLRTVNRDNRYTKLYSLMEQTMYFKKEIDYNWKNLRTKKILRLTNNFDYLFISSVIFSLVIIVNICILAIMEDHGRAFLGHDTLYYIHILSFLIAALDAFLIIIWSFTKLPLYYTIESQKYLDRIKINNRNKINFLDKLIILFKYSILGRKEINSLIWILVFTLVASIDNNFTFLYSLALFAVVNLSMTLNNIILSIYLKGRQLLWTAIFTFVILYVYSAWGYFYMQERFIDSAREVPEQMCSSLFYCLLTVSNLGLRKHAGIGQYLKPVSFFDHIGSYFNRWFYDFTFYILIVIIMLHIVFGIILDTFRDLRKKAYDTEYDIANKCFICGVERDELEKDNKNFQEHCNVFHNTWDYVDYMITLRLKDAQELNAINSYAKEQLEIKNISWLPVHINDKEGEEE